MKAVASGVAVGTLVLFTGAATTSAQAPQLVPPLAHSGAVRHVAVATDGSFFVTVSDDDSVLLWSLPTARPLRKLRATGVTSLAIHPRDRTIALGYASGALEILDPNTTSRLRRLQVPSRAAALTWSPDGAALVAVSGREIYTVGTDDVPRRAAATRSDSTTIAFTSDRRRLIAHDALGGTLTVLDSTEWADVTAPHLKGLRAKALAIHPSGDEFATVTADGEIVRWSAATQQAIGAPVRLPDTSAVAYADGVMLVEHQTKFSVIDLATASRREIDRLISPVVTAIASGPNGLVVAGAFGGEVLAWPSGTRGDPIRFAARDIRVTAIAARGDDLWVTATSRDTSFPGGIVWRIGAEISAVRLAGPVYSIFDRWRDQRGMWAAASSGLGTGSLFIQNLEDDEDVEVIEVDGEIAAVSSNGRWVATRSDSGKNTEVIKVRDLAAETDAILGQLPSASELMFAPRPELLATIAPRGAVELWDVQRQRRVARLGPDLKLPPNVIAPTAIAMVAFRADSAELAVAYFDGTVRTFSNTGRAIKTFPLTGAIRAVSYSSDGTKLTIGFADGQSHVLDAITGTVIARVSDGVSVESTYLDVKRGWLLGADANGVISYYDTDDWRVAGQLHLRSLDGQWLFATPDGLFDGDESSWHDALWRFGDLTFSTEPIESFFSDYFSPGLHAAVLKKRPPSAAIGVSTRDRATPTLALRSAVTGETAARHATVAVHVTGTLAAHDVRLFRNGTLIHQWPGETPPSAVLTWDAALVAGVNRFTSYGFNASNVRTDEAALEMIGAEALRRPGELYVLSIGIDQYANPDYKLSYAVADAVAVAERLVEGRKDVAEFAASLGDDLDRARRSGEQLQGGIVARARRFAAFAGEAHVTVLRNSEASKSRVLEELQAIARRAQPEDSVVVFFSGHGTGDGARYYLLPHDFGYAGPRAGSDERARDAIRTHAISDEDLERALESLQAGVAAIIIDACESGLIVDAASDWRRGPINSRGLAQLAYEKGIYLLAASQSYQNAHESSRLGHGLLTYTLVEKALGPTSPLFKDMGDGVTLPQVLEFTARQLPVADSEGASRPLEPRTSRGTQQPRLMRRRVRESEPLLVALTALDPLRPQPLETAPAAGAAGANDTKPVGDPEKPTLLPPVAAVGEIAAAAALPGGRIAIANRRGYLDVWQLHDMVRVAHIAVGQPPVALAPAPTGETVALLTGLQWQSPSIVIVDTRNNVVVRRFADIARGSIGNPSIAWSADARALLVTVRDAALILDARTGFLIKRIDEPAISQGFFTRGDTDVVTVASSRIGVWPNWRTASSGARGPVISLDGRVLAAAIDSGGQRIATLVQPGSLALTRANQELTVFELPSGQRLGDARKLPGEPKNLMWRGGSVLIASDSGDVTEVDPISGSTAARWRSSAPYIGGLAIVDNTLVGFGLDDVMVTWNLDTGNILTNATIKTRYHVLALAGDAIHVAGGSDDELVSAAFEGPLAATRIAHQSDRRVNLSVPLVMTRDAKTLHIWDPATLGRRATLRAPIDTLSVAADGTRVIYCTETNAGTSSEFFVWNASETKRLFRHAAECPAMVADAAAFVLATHDKPLELTLRDSRTGRNIGRVVAKGAELDSIEKYQLSGDGTLVAFAASLQAAVIRVRDQKLVWQSTPAGLTTAIAFSKDNEEVAFGTENGRLVSVNLSNGKARNLAPIDGSIARIVFGANDRLIFVLGLEGILAVYSRLTGEQLVTAEAGNSVEEWIVRTPDGRFDASPAMLKRLMQRSPEGRAVSIEDETARRYAVEGLLQQAIKRAQ